MNRREILERERRWAKPAGIAAILATPLYILSTAIQSASGIVATSLPTEQLRSLSEHEGELLLSAVTGALSLGLIGAPLLYLFKAAQARSDRVSGAMVGFPILASGLLFIQGVLLGVGQADLASKFVADAGAGGDVYNLLEDLSDDSTVLAITQSLSLPAFLALIISMVYVSLQAMRVGLLTRFMGSLGMALGFGVILFPFLGVPYVAALLAIIVWSSYAGFLILGRVPRGRPPAWETGEAMPWEAQGESAPRSSSEPDVVEGDAEEVFAGEDLKDHTARRERAKKRKRKRRQ